MNKSLAKTEGMSLLVPIDSARRHGFSLSKSLSIRSSSAAEAVIRGGGIPNESREGLSWRVLRARTPVAPRFVV